MEMYQAHLAGKILHQRCATLHPVAAVQIRDALDGPDFRAMNVAANHPVHALLARQLRHRLLKIIHVAHRPLGFELQIGRERPVTEPQPPADAIEVEVQVQQVLVNPRSHAIQQPVEMHHPIALVSVDDEIAATIRANVHHLLGQRHVAKSQAEEFVHELVVVAGDVGDPRLLAALAQQFLDQRVVVIPPEPFVFEFPAVDEIADDVEVIALVGAQKIQQRVHLRVLRAEMHVGNPDRAVAGGRKQIKILCHGDGTCQEKYRQSRPGQRKLKRGHQHDLTRL